MKISTRVLLLLLCASTVLSAQEKRWTVVNASPNPADDRKLNSPKVPEAYAVTSHFDRIVVVRLKYKADLLEGLKQMVAKEHIRNGVILAAIGSVRGYEIHQVSNRTFPSQDSYERNSTKPADLISMNGYVFNGRIHAHMTLATPDRVVGGHLEPGTQVFTFAIVTIGVMNSADLNRMDDKTFR